MADVRVEPERILPAGLAATYNAGLLVANTMQLRNTGRTFMHFKKSAAVDCTVTIITPKTVGGLAVAEQAIVVPATTGDMFMGPFPPNIYNNGDGDLEFNVTDVDGLTAAFLEL